MKIKEKLLALSLSCLFLIGFTSCNQKQFTLQGMSEDAIVNQLMYTVTWTGYQNGFTLDDFTERTHEFHDVTSSSYTTWDGRSYSNIRYKYTGEAFVGMSGYPPYDTFQEIRINDVIQVTPDYHSRIEVDENSNLMVIAFVTGRDRAEYVYSQIVDRFIENGYDVHDHHRTDEYWHASAFVEDTGLYRDFIKIEFLGGGGRITVINYYGGL